MTALQHNKNERPPEAKTRILFVCLGNIVRSPLAENLFRDLADRSGRGERFDVDSAGIGGWHAGEMPDARMRRVAEERGLVYGGRARQVGAEDFDRFDWIIAMDASNRSALQSLAQTGPGRARIRMLREFDPDCGPDPDVPDPYYGGLDDFVEVYEIVARACAGLLKAFEDGSIG